MILGLKLRALSLRKALYQWATSPVLFCFILTNIPSEIILLLTGPQGCGSIHFCLIYHHATFMSFLHYGNFNTLSSSSPIFYISLYFLQPKKPLIFSVFILRCSWAPGQIKSLYLKNGCGYNFIRTQFPHLLTDSILFLWPPLIITHREPTEIVFLALVD